MLGAVVLRLKGKNMARLMPGWLSRCVLLLAIAAPLAVSAQENNNLLPETMLRRYGLKRAWFAQVQLDGSRGKLTFLSQHISQARAYTVFEVSYDDKVIPFSEREIDRFGEMVGKERAQKMAEEKMQLLVRSLKKPKLATKVYPDITLVAQTDRGVLHVLDGETGRTRWVVSIGDPRHPSTSASANDKYVAVCHGSKLFVYDLDTGKAYFEKQLGSAPGAGPAMGGDLVYVPLINGRLEGYHLKKPETPPWIYQASGRCLITPTISPASMNLVTDRGYMYVAMLDQAFVRFKFEAHDTSVAPATFSHRQLYLSSTDGYTYAVHEVSGNQVWRFSTGEPILQSPIPIGDEVFVATDRAGMYSVAADSGQERWWTPSVRQVLGASKDRLYTLDDSLRIGILDRKTGGRVGSLPAARLDLWYSNWATDRLYLATKSGLIQCIHETPYDHPLIHLSTEDATKPDPKKKPMGDKENPFGGVGGEKPMQPMEADPFGAGGDKPAPMPMPPMTDDPFAAPPAGGAPKPPMPMPPAMADDPFAPK